MRAPRHHVRGGATSAHGERTASSTATTLFTPIVTDSVSGSTTDPLGRPSSFRADRWGQPLRITDPIGQSHTGAIDYLSFNNGLLTSVTPSGETQRQIRYGGWAQPNIVWGTGRPAQRLSIGQNGRVDWVRVGGADSLSSVYCSDSRLGGPMRKRPSTVSQIISQSD